MPAELGPVTVAGSVIRECQMCGRRVWIAPSGQRLLEEDRNTAQACLHDLLAGKVAPPDGLELAPGQLEELSAELMRRAKARSN